MKTTWLWFASIFLAGGLAWAGSQTDNIGSKLRCGFPGEVKSLLQRIQDCASKNPLDSARKSDDSGAKIKLVARTDEGNEVWVVNDREKPELAALLIGDARANTMNWENAKAACASQDSPEKRIIPNANWQLPTGDEYAHIGRENQERYNDRENNKIYGDGLWDKLRNMHGRFFWSSSPAGVNAWVLDGSYGDVDVYGRYGIISVRCAGR